MSLSSGLSFRPTGEIFPIVLCRPKLRQRVLLVVLINHFHVHADLHVIRRTADDVADQAWAFVEIDERNIVRCLAFIGRVPGAVIAHERVDFAFTAELGPFIIRRQAVRTGALRRVGEKLATGFAALSREFVLAQICPKRFGFELFEKRFNSCDCSAAAVTGFAHRAPRIKLACMHRLPPWPLTMPALAFFTWRSGSTSLPRSWRAASVTCSMPAIGACESKPPCVLTGNSPPTSIRPFLTKSLPSPFLP